MAFDSVQVRFKNAPCFASPLAETRVVPFVGSYFEILKSVVEDVKTEYFWFFSSFMKLDAEFDFDYLPEQHQRDQIHVWYTTHPTGGSNKEGNVMLIPTRQFKENMNGLIHLRDFQHINYHPHPTLIQQPIGKTYFKLRDPMQAYRSEKVFYKWMINKDCECEIPDFYPSFWEDVKMYTWGPTKDIILIPGDRDIDQFYDVDRSVHFDLDYKYKNMDIIFLSYDEPNADQNWRRLKNKFPRAKRSHGVKGRTEAYHTAASMSETDYFFAVFPTIEIADDFDFEFQPDRLREACHYIFHCRNPVNGLEYGHRAVILYNKHLCLSTIHPRLDFTLSQPHTVVPKLCGTSHFNVTPEISWRVAFREVLKLCEMKPTVESKFRLKKWCELGTGDHAEWVQKGALDAVEYFEANRYNKKALMLSYELSWLKEKFKSTS